MYAQTFVHNHCTQFLFHTPIPKFISIMALNTPSFNFPVDVPLLPTPPSSNSPVGVPLLPTPPSSNSPAGVPKSRTVSPERDMPKSRAASPHPIISKPLEDLPKQDSPNSRTVSPESDLPKSRAASVISKPSEDSPTSTMSDSDYSCNKRVSKRRRSGSVSTPSPDKVERSNGGAPPLTKIFPPGNIKRENAAAKKKGSAEMRFKRGLPI